MFLTLIGSEDRNATLAVSRADVESYAYSAWVRVHLSESNVQRFAHKALLTAYSPYFEACLKLAFTEGQNLVVKLDEVSTRVFDAFLGWLYTGNLNAVRDAMDKDDYFSIEVYKFADRLLIQELKNDIIDRIRRSLRDNKQIPAPYSIVRVSQAGLLESKLGELFLHHFVYAIGMGKWNIVSEMPEFEGDRAAVEHLREDSDALMAVVRETIRYHNEVWYDPLLADDCDFHEHANGQRCLRKCRSNGLGNDSDEDEECDADEASQASETDDDGEDEDDEDDRGHTGDENTSSEDSEDNESD